MTRIDHSNLLVVPHLRIQNANAISSQLTWGFPAISAFMGFMRAIERKLGSPDDLRFNAIGIVCHYHQTQLNRKKYHHRFNLTRNPVGKDGKLSPIVQEGRMHLEITLIFSVDGNVLQESKGIEKAFLVGCYDTICSMRIAGGSIIPQNTPLKACLPYFIKLDNAGLDNDQEKSLFRGLCYKLLPGFALVARDDLLLSHLNKLRVNQQEATLLDAWLDQVRSNWIPEKNLETEQVTWRNSREIRGGWIVPIPVGYQALSEVYRPGIVGNVRDKRTPFRFVETVYSLGEWISPHRINDINDLFWCERYDRGNGLYRFYNNYYPKKIEGLSND